MHRSASMAAFVAVILCACGQQPIRDDGDPSFSDASLENAEEKEAAIEAVFTYQIEHHPLSDFPGVYVRCLALPVGKDPDPGLLIRMSRLAEVTGISNCESNPEGVYTSSGRRGLVLSIDGIRVLDENTMLIEASYYFDPLGARTDVVRVKNQEGEWRVEATEMRSISSADFNIRASVDIQFPERLRSLDLVMVLEMQRVLDPPNLWAQHT